jgi:hypothetical protein
MKTLLIFLACCAVTAQAATYRFAKLGGDNGALTSVDVTPTGTPFLFGGSLGGALGSFALGDGLTLTDGVLSASGGDWDGISGTPTTLAGYGIADAITAALAASTYQPIIGDGTLALAKLATDPLARANHTGTQGWSTITGTPTTLAGYGIADAITAALAASTYQPIIGDGTLALAKLATDPLARANHTGTQAWSTISGTPTTLAGYGIADAITAALAASTYQPINDNLTTLAAGFGGLVPAGQFVRWTGTAYVLETPPALASGSSTNKFLTWSGSSWAPTSTSAARDLIMPGAPSPISSNYSWSTDGTTLAWRSIKDNLDSIGSTRGSILYRGAAGWVVLTPGTSGYALTSNGSGADPTYQAIPSILATANTFTQPQSINVASGTILSLKLAGTDFTYVTDAGLYIGMPGVSGWQVRLVSNWGALGIYGNTISYNSGLHYRAAGPSGEIEYFNLWDTGSANQMDLRNGTAAQVLRVTNTATSATDWEAFVIDWQTTANTVRVGSEVGSGGGTARDVQIIRGGVVKATIGAATNSHAQPVKLPSYTVSGLPSAATVGAGSMAFVTDATATTAYTTVAGSGSNKVLVISDGTNWIIH